MSGETIYLSKEQSWKHNREKGLQSFYCMRKRNCNFSKAHVSEKITKRVYNGQW